MANHEKAPKPRTLAERRAEAGRIFDELNKPGTVTRGMADLYRAGGPSTAAGKKVMAENSALRNAFARLRRITEKASESKSMRKRPLT
jgi:hypothetical protein